MDPWLKEPRSRRGHSWRGSAPPRRRGAHVAGKDRVLRGQLVDHPGHVLGMDGLLARLADRQLVEALARLLVVCERGLEVPVVLVLGQPGQERGEGALDVAHETVIEAGAPAELFSSEVDLGRSSRQSQEVPVRKSVPSIRRTSQSSRVIADANPIRPVMPTSNGLYSMNPSAHRVHIGALSGWRLDQIRVGSRTPRAPRIVTFSRH